MRGKVSRHAICENELKQQYKHESIRELGWGSLTCYIMILHCIGLGSTVSSNFIITYGSDHRA